MLYLNTELDPALFEGLGPHRRGVGCLYIKRLSDVDHAVLRTLIERGVELTFADPRQLAPAGGSVRICRGQLRPTWTQRYSSEIGGVNKFHDHVECCSWRRGRRLGDDRDLCQRHR